jgi:hypothetical protein
MKDTYNIKCKCTTYWGAPALVDEEGKYYVNVSSLKVKILKLFVPACLVPVGDSVNMGHGCGSGHSASGLIVRGYTVIPEDFVEMKFIGEKV